MRQIFSYVLTSHAANGKADSGIPPSPGLERGVYVVVAGIVVVVEAVVVAAVVDVVVSVAVVIVVGSVVVIGGA